MKNIIIISILIISSLSIVYAQDSNTNNTNEEATTNFFNIPAETENASDNEPAILEDIRNIENRASVSTTGMFIRAIILLRCTRHGQLFEKAFQSYSFHHKVQFPYLL